MSSAYLILENGAVFKGRSFGYEGEAVGEVVFSTGMAEYLETLSDPAYFGQIVLQTFPLIGNYGIIPQDLGPGPAHLKAYIVRDWCQEPSNFRSEGTLDTFLRNHRIPGLFGIDTRKLTRLIRSNGVMNAMISKTPELSEAQWAELRGYSISGAVEAVAEQRREWKVENGKSKVSEEQRDAGNKNSSRVVIWDFGSAFKLSGQFAAFGCDVSVVGHDATADAILSLNPDGVAFSGGPGDPSENTRIIGDIKELCGKSVPILAVGLGHQMLALAHGARTGKLLFGHRGINQPVIHRKTGHAFVTTQNHGYTVESDSLPGSAEVSYENLSDMTCEGIDYSDIPAFSVQFDPTGEIIERFMMMQRKGASKCR